MWVSVWLWMVGQRGDLEAALEYPEDLSLSILHEDHTKICACKNLPDQKRRTKDISQSRVEKQLVKSGTLKQSVGSETPEQRGSQSERRLRVVSWE